MKYSPLFSTETSIGRRRFAGFAVGAALVAVALAACADLRSTPRDPNDPPFWEREEQRD